MAGTKDDPICPDCDGEGIFEMECSCAGKSPAYDCKRCDNTGLRSERCATCQGSGHVDELDAAWVGE